MRWLLIAISLAAHFGCDDPHPSIAVPPDATYTVRGRIADIIGSEISIQHEAIPGFRNQAGETVGMGTMTMAFYRPDGVSLEGLGTDDLVEFTFDMRWGGNHIMSISAIRALPSGTSLAL